VICEAASKKCARYQVLAPGAACTTAFYPAILCQNGTYCSKADGSIGACLAELGPGEACSFQECGIGNRCTGTQCAPGLAVGELCTSAFECATGLCACAAATCLSGEQKKCVEVVLVDKASCVPG
jgi:hypothetical protein